MIPIYTTIDSICKGGQGARWQSLNHDTLGGRTIVLFIAMDIGVGSSNDMVVSTCCMRDDLTRNLINPACSIEEHCDLLFLTIVSLINCSPVWPFVPSLSI